MDQRQNKPCSYSLFDFVVGIVRALFYFYFIFLQQQQQKTERKRLLWHLFRSSCVCFVYFRWNVNGTLEMTLSILFLLMATLRVVILFQIVLRANLHVSFLRFVQRIENKIEVEKKNK